MNVSRIYTYPVKSTAGLELESASVGPTGIQFDRHWVVIDERGVAVTARELPRLVLIHSRMGRDGPECIAEGMPPCPLPSADGGRSFSFRLFDEQCSGLSGFDAADRWFSKFLEQPVSLARIDPERLREVGEDGSKPGDVVSFADEYPLLLVSQASLDDLNTRLEPPVTMRNFRPNIVVDGCPPYAEDGWSGIVIGGIRLRAGKRCARCVLTTVDPDLGQRDAHQQPLRTLSGYRRTGAETFFGLTLIADNPGRIARGMQLEASL